MAAIIDIHTGSTINRAPLHRSTPAASRPSAARLRLIEGGRSQAGLRMRRVYFLRRCFAAAVVIVVLAGIGLIGRSVVDGHGVAPARPTTAANTYIVRAGDTLWGVSRSIAPDSDPRDVVDAIAAVNGSDGAPFDVNAPLTPGQELSLPAAA